MPFKVPCVLEGLHPIQVPSLLPAPGASKVTAAEANAVSRLPEGARMALLEALLHPLKQVGSRGDNSGTCKEEWNMTGFDHPFILSHFHLKTIMLCSLPIPPPYCFCTLPSPRPLSVRSVRMSRKIPLSAPAVTCTADRGGKYGA